GGEPIDAQFYGLAGPEEKTPIRRMKSRGGEVTSDASGDALLATALDSIRDYVTAIRHGDFPVLVRGSGGRCRYCDFRTICRYSERRAKNKLGERKPWFEQLARERTEKADKDG
ncbi:MAG TPA: hypothetical protein VMX57_09300, partial [Planctomycetota bacterium]|nr:hypothetical protein [Planctomycetota bacterium]